MRKGHHYYSNCFLQQNRPFKKGLLKLSAIEPHARSYLAKKKKKAVQLHVMLGFY